MARPNDSHSVASIGPGETPELPGMAPQAASILSLLLLRHHSPHMPFSADSNHLHLFLLEPPGLCPRCSSAPQAFVLLLRPRLHLRLRPKEVEMAPLLQQLEEELPFMEH